MKTILMVTGLTLFIAAAGLAQPIGFGVGGFMLGWLTLDLQEINQALEAAGYPILDEHVLVMGGSGSGGVTKGISLGGMGFGGSVDAMSGTRSVELDVGFGGVVLEYVERASPRALVGLGVVLGGGSVTLTSRARLAEDFDDALASPAVTQLNAGFMGGMGTLRVQLMITEWLSLDGWAGYLIGLPDRWQDDHRKLAGPLVPSRGPFLGVRITFGGVGSVPPSPRDPQPPESPQDEESNEQDPAEAADPTPATPGKDEDPSDPGE